MLQDPIVVSNNQFINFGKLLVSGRHGSDVFEKDGIATYWAESPSIFYNLLFLSEPISGRAMLDARLRAAADYMRSKKEQGLFLVSDDYLDADAQTQLGVALKQAGLVPAMDTTGMNGNLRAFKEAVKHPDLRFERVASEDGFRECADINSEAYGLPPAPMRDGIDGATLWKKGVFCYLAYHGDRAVATASVVEFEGALYVAYVATRPHAQRHGFAEATMRHALSAASEATGLQSTWLHSSEAGYPVYTRMGYTPVTRIVGFTLATASV